MYTFSLSRTDIEPENPQYEQYIASFFDSFIRELEAKAESLHTEDLFLTKLKLMEAAKNFRVSIPFKQLSNINEKNILKHNGY